MEYKDRHPAQLYPHIYPLGIDYVESDKVFQSVSTQYIVVANIRRTKK